MAADPPLSTLLSWALIAFTIELDNEFEHRMAAASPHRDFHVSFVMWENFLRHVGPDGLEIGTLPELAGVAPGSLHVYLAMERWGYVAIEPDRELRPRGRPRPTWVVRKTGAGERAAEVWQGLAEEIERRWVDRFGGAAIADLRHFAEALVTSLRVSRPRYLPVVGYADGMRVHALPAEDRRPKEPEDAAVDLVLPALLSLVLLELTLDFERRSDLSLALSANVVRVLGDGARPLRDLPGLVGTSREAVQVSVGFLERHGYVQFESGSNVPRGRSVSLTPKGKGARDHSIRLLTGVETEWENRLGQTSVAGLAESLTRILGRREGDRWLLAQGLIPYAEGWRATRPYRMQTEAMMTDPMKALPHYPLVTHRGGWPDGS
jgi:DNA-binding MarR family transcriptional regulator